jgi:hypothetical protein
MTDGAIGATNMHRNFANHRYRRAREAYEKAEKLWNNAARKILERSDEATPDDNEPDQAITKTDNGTKGKGKAKQPSKKRKWDGLEDSGAVGG